MIHRTENSKKSTFWIVMKRSHFSQTFEKDGMHAERKSRFTTHSSTFDRIVCEPVAIKCIVHLYNISPSASRSTYTNDYPSEAHQKSVASQMSMHIVRVFCSAILSTYKVKRTNARQKMTAQKIVAVFCIDAYTVIASTTNFNTVQSIQTKKWPLIYWYIVAKCSAYFVRTNSPAPFKPKQSTSIFHISIHFRICLYICCYCCSCSPIERPRL